jgi:hypothetical protein
MRHAHVIKKNERCETMYNAIVLYLNIVTLNRTRKHVQYDFDFGVMLHGVKSHRSDVWTMKYYRWESVVGLWRILGRILQEKTRTFVWLTESIKTIALLDVFSTGVKNGWEITKAVLGCPPLILSLRQDDTTMTWLDIRNFWPTASLDICAGENADTQYVTKRKQEHSPSDSGVKSWLRRLMDRITAWTHLLRREDLGGFAPTMASQAMRTFRHRYMKHEILIDANTESLALARKAYYGGRNECFFVGRMRGDFYLVDINSMYAACMRNLRTPVRLRGYRSGAKCDQLRRWIREGAAIASVRIKTSIPMLPLRNADKLNFPIGEFVTTLAGDELKYAVMLGLVTDVYEAACYDTAYAFTEFVDDFWQRRIDAIKRGDRESAEAYKSLLASFYGKWGQSGGYWETFGEADDLSVKTWTEISYETKAVTEWRQFGGIVQRRTSEPESRDSSPAIAACITAAARMKLWQLMGLAGRQNVFYVDTDSLLVNSAGFSGLREYIHPDMLGGLRLEGEFHDVEINACKDYVFGERRRRKGVGRNAHVVSDDTFEMMTTESLNTMFRGGRTDVAGGRMVRKRLTRDYVKGKVLPDGTVLPLEVYQ